MSCCRPVPALVPQGRLSGWFLEHSRLLPWKKVPLDVLSASGHADHPSNQASVRPTVVRRPGLPTYKTSIVLTATIITLFKATAKEITKEVARPKAATFVVALNRVNIVAVNTVLVLHLSQPGGLLAGRAVNRIYGGSDGHASDWLS